MPSRCGGGDGTTQGRAVVKIGRVSKNIVRTPGASACRLDEPTRSRRQLGRFRRFKIGTRSRRNGIPVIEFSPGVAPRVHRTDSIDYAVVIFGEIDMELEKAPRCTSRRDGPLAARHRALLDQPRQGPVRDGPSCWSMRNPVTAGGKVLTRSVTRGLTAKR